jgi:hypothetical protein
MVLCRLPLKTAVTSRRAYSMLIAARTPRLPIALVVIAAISFGGKPLRAQEPRVAPEAQSALDHSAIATVPRPAVQSRSGGQHRFWDTTNDWLVAGVAASRTLDYFSTLNMRRRGRQEILLSNDAVDNHAAFAVIEAAGTGVSIGASYLFHRYGHHKLERWVSFVHIGLATTGSVRNYCLKTFHTVPARPAQ